MIVSGDPISAEDALKHGLVKRVVPNTSFDGALEFARDIGRARKHPKLRDQATALPVGKVVKLSLLRLVLKAPSARAGYPHRSAASRLSKPRSSCHSNKAWRSSANTLSSSCSRTNQRRCATCSSRTRGIEDPRRAG